jgi:hypothetical protein
MIWTTSTSQHEGARLPVCEKIWGVDDRTRSMPPPPEIIDHILSYLHSDIPTLKACSNIFPESVDRYLFADITIYTSLSSSSSSIVNAPDGSYVVDGIIQCENLMRLFTARPHITHYVRRLSFIIGWGPQLLLDSSLMSTHFPNLASIALGSNSTQVSWNVLDPSFHSGFLNILALPTIKQVAIVDIPHFPLDSLDKCSNLRNLVLLGMFSEDNTASPSPFPYLNLRSLQATSQSFPTRFISWANSKNTLQSQSLDFRMREAPCTFIHSIVGAYATSLTELEVDFSTCKLRVYSSLERHHLLNLF